MEDGHVRAENLMLASILYLTLCNENIQLQKETTEESVNPMARTGIFIQKYQSVLHARVLTYSC